MRDFETDRAKVLDLVICTPRSDSTYPALTKSVESKSLKDLAAEYKIALSSDESRALNNLPDILTAPVGTVLVALEAKATMTEHIKALPRLHDELDSSHSTIHGSTDDAIAVALVSVNISETFVSPDRNKFPGGRESKVRTTHRQPVAAERTISKVREIRRRSRAGAPGFDAMGIVVFDFANDGQECRLHDGPPAPASDDTDNYQNMIDRIHSLYAAKFSQI